MRARATSALRATVAKGRPLAHRSSRVLFASAGGRASISVSSRRGWGPGASEKMLTAALTGGIATGKSHVLERFRRLGAACLDADELAHGATAAGTEATQAIAARFGAAMLDATGAVDRKKLGPLVFADAGGAQGSRGDRAPGGLPCHHRRPAGVRADGLAQSRSSTSRCCTKRQGRSASIASLPPSARRRRSWRGCWNEGCRSRTHASGWRRRYRREEKAARADFVIRTDGTFRKPTPR